MPRPGAQPSLRHQTPDELGPFRQELPIEIGCLLDGLPEAMAGLHHVRVRLEDIGQTGAKHLEPFALLCGPCVPGERVVARFGQFAWRLVERPLHVQAVAVRPAFGITIATLCLGHHPTTNPWIIREIGPGNRDLAPNLWKRES
jgi:hypothetical protein